jgi:EAL domain-containing protein (putative c-di-GMP-specific phosphodiesterase class I)/PleD family two-component response regulator
MSEQLPVILVVEDAAPIRMLLKAGLTKAGYRVVEAANGREGIAAFSQHRPQLVLMDVNMPEMDGFESCRGIRALETAYRTPVVMLTGSDDIDSINQAFEAGATDFIAKPINLPLLLQRIRYALRDAEREATLRRVQQQQNNARKLAGLAYWELDPANGQIQWTSEAGKMLPWMEPLPLTPRSLSEMVVPGERKRLQDAIQHAVDNRLSFDIELQCLDAEQCEHVLRIVGQGDADKRVFGAVQDLTQQRSLERQANYLYYHDSVTGLPNRALFLQSLADLLQRTPKTQQIVVLVIEVQRIQEITDAYGQELADTLLRLVGSELRQLAGEGALCARLQGGRFGFVRSFPAETGEQSILYHYEQQLQTLDRNWIIDGRELYLNFTGGIGSSKAAAEDAGLLLRMAKSAQRSIRPDGAITLALYQKQHDRSLHELLDLEADLRRAVEQEQFHLVYQPQLDLASQQIVGVEALLRWVCPQRGFVSPAEFIPVLEEMGLITVLGEWILNEACRQQVRWARAGVDLRMGINLSAVQFQQPNLTMQIEAAVHNSGADRSRIELEITESMAMGDPDQTIAVLHRLREAGFKIAIDDFGVGFSSLEYLLHFPLDTLKIDRAFVTDVAQTRRDRAIVRALTNLCTGLGLTTIAEGVETQRQCDYLDALGATEIQGYLLSRPLPGQELFEFVQRFSEQGWDAVNG